MKRIKKLIALTVVLALALCTFGCAKQENTAENDYTEIYNQTSVTLSAESDTFKVLKINDTHFINGTCKNDKKTLEVLKGVLDKTECDLIICDGDIIEGNNKKITFDKYKALKIFCELLEEYSTPWTFAPGNNDGEKDGTNEDVIAFMMNYEHFLCGNKEGIDGSMQFFIDIQKDGELVHSIAVMDSHSHDENGEYDYIKENQIDWLLSGIEQRRVYTSVFFHMPTPAFEAACKNGEAYEGFPFSDKYSVSDIKRNSLFDEKTADNEYISLISTGHVHSDNIAYYYNNRYYQLSSLGGYGAAGSKNCPVSYTLTTINLNAESVKEMYEFEKLS